MLVRSEIDALRNMDHPCLLKGYEVFRSTDNIRVIVDYVSTETVKKRVLSSPHGRLDFRESLEIIYRLTSGVAHLHEKGLVHLNIHPESVRFKDTDRSFDCVLCEMGFAKTDAEAAKGGLGFSGVYGFGAPEVMKKGGCSGKSDVFSLGVTLYSM